MNNDEYVYEFIYCPCRFESAFTTISIHKTKKGAEMAMEFHKHEVKKEYFKKYGVDMYKYTFDSDKLWDIRESKLLL